MKIIFTFLLLIIGIHLMAQNSSNDIIYPIDEAKPIKNCKIIRIENGNLVFYTLMGKERSIKAMLIKKDGKYIDLSEDENKANTEIEIINPEQNSNPQIIYEERIIIKDYNYFHHEYQRAKKIEKLGVIITVVGAGLSGFGFTSRSRGESTEDATASKLGSVMLISGLAMVSVGIPLWISGGIKSRNNKAAMDQLKTPKTSFNLGISENGLAIVFVF